jgi:hypothetical protein
MKSLSLPSVFWDVFRTGASGLHRIVLGAWRNGPPIACCREFSSEAEGTLLLQQQSKTDFGLFLPFDFSFDRD